MSVGQMKNPAVRVSLLVGIYCFVVFVKRWETVSRPPTLEICAHSQIPPSVHPSSPAVTSWPLSVAETCLSPACPFSPSHILQRRLL